jgi:hypothetical protein
MARVAQQRMRKRRGLIRRVDTVCSWYRHLWDPCLGLLASRKAAGQPKGHVPAFELLCAA